MDTFEIAFMIAAVIFAASREAAIAYILGGFTALAALYFTAFRGLHGDEITAWAFTAAFLAVALWKDHARGVTWRSFFD